MRSLRVRVSLYRLVEYLQNRSVSYQLQDLSCQKCKAIKDDNIRELHLYSYRILYEIKPPNIEVLAVVHKRRDFKAEEIR